MIVSDVGKLSLMVVFTVGLFVLVAIGSVTFGEAAPFFTLEVGYLFGNGVSAVRRSAGTSVLVPNIREDEVLTVSGSYPAKIEGDGHDG